jgi:hypothetical protein
MCSIEKIGNSEGVSVLRDFYEKHSREKNSARSRHFAGQKCDSEL